MERRLMLEMVEYYRGDPKRIQHFTKVHAYAALIGRMEGLKDETQRVLEAAALVHDIGIRPSENKYGRCDGKLQELEGPAPARTMLARLGYPGEVIDRVAFLVGHHHTYDRIEGLDYQILVEADFLVNLFEDAVPEAAARKACETIFRTESGIRLCQTMFGLN